MSKVTKIGRDEHRLISARVRAALLDLEKELGVKFSTDGGNIGSTTGMIKLKVALHDAATGVDGKKSEFAYFAKYHRFDPEAYGKTFVVKNTVYRIVGYSPSRPVYPVDAVRVADEAPFKFPLDVIQRNFPMKAA